MTQVRRGDIWWRFTEFKVVVFVYVTCEDKIIRCDSDVCISGVTQVTCKSSGAPEKEQRCFTSRLLRMSLKIKYTQTCGSSDVSKHPDPRNEDFRR